MQMTNTQNQHLNHYAATRLNSLPFASSFMQTDQQSHNFHSGNIYSLNLCPASPLSAMSNEAEYPSHLSAGQTWNLDPSAITATSPFSYGYPHCPTDQGLHGASKFAPGVAAYPPSFYFTPTVFPGDYTHTGLSQGLQDDDEEAKRLYALYIAADVEHDEQENGSTYRYPSIQEDSPTSKSLIKQKSMAIRTQKRAKRRNQKPWSFFCEYCQKNVCMSRKRHMTMHTKEKDYECLCGAEFTRKDKRNDHVRRKPHGAKCGYPYGDRNSGRLLERVVQPSEPSTSQTGQLQFLFNDF